ncbi:MAG TPA: NEW3 domain-containing protein [Pelobium sp.]|nr:NEW3 domain-containing protein [Pelobium sp.]
MQTELSLNYSRTLRGLTFLLLLNLVFTTQWLYAQGTKSLSAGQSTFTAKLMNLEQPSNETFRYSTTLYNGSSKTLVYELEAGLSPGWTISYNVDGSQVTSLSMEPGKTQNISIEIGAMANATPKKYHIPVKAISGKDTLILNLEAVVKGSYGLAFGTPSGKLNEELTSGSTKQIQLKATNTGTLPLSGLNFSSQLPTGWECSFEPSNLDKLEPGKSVTVNANLKVPDKTIAGDYACTFKATNNNTNVQTAFRIEVKTSIFAGWIGILIILLAIGIVYYLIRKYGRR